VFRADDASCHLGPSAGDDASPRSRRFAFHSPCIPALPDRLLFAVVDHVPSCGGPRLPTEAGPATRSSQVVFGGLLCSVFGGCGGRVGGVALPAGLALNEYDPLSIAREKMREAIGCLSIGSQTLSPPSRGPPSPNQQTTPTPQRAHNKTYPDSPSPAPTCTQPPPD